MCAAHREAILDLGRCERTLIFAANLRRIRQERGLSQERLAHNTSLNMTHVAKIERSEREPGVRTVSKLARTPRVSASEPFEGIDGRDAHEGGGSDRTEQLPADQSP